MRSAAWSPPDFTQFAQPAAGGADYPASHRQGGEGANVFRRRFSLLGLIYVLVGIYVAFAHDYITIRVVKLVLSALLAIFLWPLILLGVDLRIN
jgi:hypothetical protein